jgi:hypothetical protein
MQAQARTFFRLAETGHRVADVLICAYKQRVVIAKGPRALAAAALVALLSCRRAPPPTRPPSLDGGRVVETVASEPPPTPTEEESDVLPAAGPEIPPERRAIQVVGAGSAVSERQVDADAARARGLTLVDLGDDWTPAVLDPANPYRPIYLGLAADRGDGDGQPLAAGEHNYLELYGVPPTLSVLRRRFLQDARRDCMGTVDVGKLLAVDEIRTWGASTEQKELGKHKARAQRLEAARTTAGAADLTALAVGGDARTAKQVREHLEFEEERAAFAEVEKRLVCEGLLDARKHREGSYDTAMRTAMLDFQQKHAVMDQADIRRSTLEALSRPPLENDFLALRRVLTERAVHAGGFIEDGSVGSSTSDPSYPTFLGADGKRHRVPDLATASVEAVLARLRLATPADAVAFFRRHPAADFRSLKVAARLPAAPEYYSAKMDLSAEIDRGDVWYDLPFDASGGRLPQPRERFPTLTLYVKWRGERVPLLRWRTTIGGWRAELASDGQEYYRYKGSDIGPRVWRHIVAAPVWIPPPSSPLGSMVKEKRVNGLYARVTNYDETGPGYLSAYGLVAAIHDQMSKGPDGPRFFDNGIRTHGSFDYMSLRGRFSHGCHRLDNQLAMRLFSFVLGHRRARVIGVEPLSFRRPFVSKGEVFEMRLPNRGFWYELDPPLPVDVLEGRIKGTAQKPLAGYVRKPGVKYASTRAPTAVDSPESRAGGEAP